MSKLAKLIASKMAAGMAPSDAAVSADAEINVSDRGSAMADALATFVTGIVADWQIPNDIAGRVFRHIDDDGSVTAAGSKRHNGHGGAAGTRTSGNDWLALGITRIRIGSNPLKAGVGFDVPATKWAQVLRAAAMFASSHGGFRTNAPDAPAIKITADSPVNDFTGASSAALILRTNSAIAPFVALYDGRMWATRDDVSQMLAK